MPRFVILFGGTTAVSFINLFPDIRYSFVHGKMLFKNDTSRGDTKLGSTLFVGRLSHHVRPLSVTKHSLRTVFNSAAATPRLAILESM